MVRTRCVSCNPGEAEASPASTEAVSTARILRR